MNASIGQLQVINHRLLAMMDHIDEAAFIAAPGPIRPPGPAIWYANAPMCKLSGYASGNLVNAPLEQLQDSSAFIDFLHEISSLDEQKPCDQFTADLVCADGNSKKAVWKVRAVLDDGGKTLNYLITVSEDVAKEPVQETPSPSSTLPLLRSALPPIGSSDGIFLKETDEESPAPEDYFIDDDETAGMQPVTVIDDAGSDTPVENDNIHLEKSRMESLALVASGIAHDFNNVLTTIIANLSLAKLDSQIGTELRDHIDDAAKAAESAKGLTVQLLAFARGGKKEKREEADVGSILKDAAKLATYGASVRCELGISESLWSSTIDTTQITQVINNLLINARQSMKDSGVIQANLANHDVADETGLDLDPGKYLRLDVIDHGCGIAAENVAKIFDAFFTTKKTGTGLGLATCQSIIRKHGGIISVDSTPGVGTQFSVFLPANDRKVRKQADAEPGKVYQGEGTILVVDDQDDVRAVASAMLRRLGYDVVGAPDGEQAVQLYKRRMNEGSPFACVIMDMTLPGGISGAEATDEIRKLDPFAQTIASSGYFDDTAAENCSRDGFVGILCKPYDLEKLSFALHKVLKPAN